VSKYGQKEAIEIHDNTI